MTTAMCARILSSDKAVLVGIEAPADVEMQKRNGVTGNGLQFHRLRLAINMVIILLRNLNSAIGLINGTQLIIQDLTDNLIIAKIFTKGIFFWKPGVKCPLPT